MNNNALVDFLAAYGPTSDGNNMYDEFVVEAAARAGVEPISIPEGHSSQIADDLRGSPARSVVLTGTAGDGKTYTARKVLERLGGPTTLKDITSFTDPETGRSIIFIKDMSEVTASEKSSLVPRMIASFTDPDPREVFVFCVNDGHLLRSWEEHMGGSAAGRDILTIFRELLRDDKEVPPSPYSFRLVNMSRTSHASTINAIIDQICNHPRWSDCGSGCETGAQGRCPIQINRQILLKDGNASMRTRLRALVEISAADERHLSIRQIIILVVNALLGDAKNVYATPLLNCARASQRAADGEYAYTNPYTNVFGDNHPPTRRAQNAAFSALNEFAIGFETNNFFDDILMDAKLDGIDHPQYGSASYAQARADYIENPTDHIVELRRILTAQRRRLFFEWPDAAPDAREQSPWQLSVHSYGDHYLNILLSEDERDPEMFRRTRPRLVKGLNRALTGSLTETSDRLWLTQPSGVYKGAGVPILVTGPINWSGKPYNLNLAAPASPGRPPLLQLIASYTPVETLASLPLTPTLFEYLMRVSDGALPMSFSNQCFQDVRNFQIRCVGRILDREKEDGTNFKAVDTEGETLAERSIGALESEL
ncbi:hypothetical protein [Pelagibacterium halotolerans]|uniref:Uncharacterized protein n=1 Tax=Pelagibacterium halotolerans (strain DSM 22347 / JCM 15775 / CGMCC 1.7692 / B2) TaxID=1082931 RepID=G4RC75_PELHB|nr:hypothetical protein [Pelagibacterium halotolerans]AEQ52698.1 hypothetical protein KKY_2690 [Pelagibacterium halotolerans B2]QJR17600.1 hypothetical protein HKM20_03585 [Pelagibacterium halotolerans]